MRSEDKRELLQLLGHNMVSFWHMHAPLSSEWRQEDELVRSLLPVGELEMPMLLTMVRSQLSNAERQPSGWKDVALRLCSNRLSDVRLRVGISCEEDSEQQRKHWNHIGQVPGMVIPVAEYLQEVLSVQEIEQAREVQAVQKVQIAQKSAPSANSSLEVRCLDDSDDEAQLDTWIEIIMAANGIPPDLRPLFGTIIQDVNERAGKRLKRYMGYFNGKPVSTATLWFDEHVVGLYNLGTLPEARSQGVATQMISELVQRVAKAGYRYIVFHASQDGLALYQKLGLQELGKVKGYVHIRTGRRWVRWLGNQVLSRINKDGG